MANKYTLGQLADFLGQADVLTIRITEAKSQIGHKENKYENNEQAISQIEGLKVANKGLLAEIDSMKKQISEDEIRLNELFKILKENGVPVSDQLKSTTIVNVG